MVRPTAAWALAMGAFLSLGLGACSGDKVDEVDGSAPPGADAGQSQVGDASGLDAAEGDAGPGQDGVDSGPGPGGSDASVGPSADAGAAGIRDPYVPSDDIAETRADSPEPMTDPEREQARAAYEALSATELEAGFVPDDLYGIFNRFALAYFGARAQPLLYEKFGEVLDFVASGSWLHASRNSATVAFQTTLPVKGWVEYGTSAGLGQTTAASERFFFTQVHHLRGLQADATYHYRFAATDERGQTIFSGKKTFQTGLAGQVVELPGTLAGPPYVLDQAGTTYVLTEDITADNAAIHVKAGQVVLDLNGHTITYANRALTGLDSGALASSGTGIWGRPSSSTEGIRVVNGLLQEGHVGNQASPTALGLHAILLSNWSDIELAGLTVRYHGAQVLAVALLSPKGRLQVHHNSFLDQGFEILNRHGTGGGRPVEIIDSEAQSQLVNEYEVHHNLVKRTRQNGLKQASKLNDNEIYVDSWSTNSFALQPHSKPGVVAGEVRRNKVFLTGYHAIGLGWAHRDLLVEGNYLQLEGVRTMSRRYFETWGDMDSLNGLRITNYTPGGQVRDNLRYPRNLIAGRARGGSLMRGTEFFADTSITNTLLEGSLLHVVAQDDQTADATPVVTQGIWDSRASHPPTRYSQSRLVSNVANVRFGDSYGKGNRHHFLGCTLEKVGAHPGYHTFVFDGGYDSYDHQLVDPVFLGGARADDVFWKRTSIRSAYTVLYTLTVHGPAGQALSIRDASDAEVFAGTLPAEGRLSVPLAQMTIRPSEWSAGAATSPQVTKTLEHQKILHTPHRVTRGTQTLGVTMDQPRELGL